MKNLIYVILTLAFVTPSFAADTNTATPNTNAVVANTTTKDAFLKFVLEKAEKYSDTGEKAINKAVDAIVEETPILVKEFIVWRIWKHAIAATIPVALIALFLILLYFNWGKGNFDTRSTNHNPYYHIHENQWNKEATICVISLVFGTISTIVFFANSISEYLNLIQAIIAPRIYILEQLAEFIKK